MYRNKEKMNKSVKYLCYLFEKKYNLKAILNEIVQKNKNASEFKLDTKIIKNIINILYPRTVFSIFDHIYRENKSKKKNMKAFWRRTPICP